MILVDANILLYAEDSLSSFGNHNWPICGTLFWPTLSN
jgi:hypothetical protein